MAGIGWLISGLAGLIRDSIPSKHAGGVEDYRYELLDGVASLGALLLVFAFVLWLRAEWNNEARGPYYVAFLLVAVAAFLIAHPGFDAYARITVSGATQAVAMHSALTSLILDAGASFLLLGPFLLIALFVGAMARAGEAPAAFVLFSIALGVLLWIYFEGHIDAEKSALARKWTAATMSIAFLPLKSLVPVLLCFLISRKVVRLRRANDT